MITALGAAHLLLTHVWKLHGLLRQVVSDWGPQFIAEFTRELYQLLRVELAATVGCIYAHYKVNPNIFQFYSDFMNIFHHPPMHPLFRNICEFYLIFYYFISSFIIYNNHFYLRRYFLF